MSKQKQAEMTEWREKLARMLKPGDTVYTILRHVSRSGMSRRIGVAFGRNGDFRDWDGVVAAALGERWDRDKGGVIVGGCGMDMGFHLVYNLGAVLWPNGFDCTGEKCPSNDHSNGDRNYSPDNHHNDGGYALRQRWI